MITLDFSNCHSNYSRLFGCCFLTTNNKLLNYTLAWCFVTTNEQSVHKPNNKHKCKYQQLSNHVCSVQELFDFVAHFAHLGVQRHFGGFGVEVQVLFENQSVCDESVGGGRAVVEVENHKAAFEGCELLFGHCGERERDRRLRVADGWLVADRRTSRGAFRLEAAHCSHCRRHAVEVLRVHSRHAERQHERLFFHSGEERGARVQRQHQYLALQREPAHRGTKNGPRESGEKLVAFWRQSLYRTRHDRLLRDDLHSEVWLRQSFRPELLEKSDHR